MPEIAEPTTRYEIRYRARPAWEVGERTPEHMPGEHYPGDFTGQVIDVREVDSPDPSLRHMEDKDRPVIELDLTSSEASELKARTTKIIGGKPAPITFEDRWGAVANPLRLRFAGAEIAERKLELGIQDAEAEEFGRVSCALMRALPVPDVHTGTGRYYTKKIPAHLDRTQSGAPAGQVITLTVGGLGTADAYIGGYVTNATRAETRAIVSHTDDTTTLEGGLGNWLDTHDLDVYDAWSTVQGAADMLWANQSTVAFTASQYIRIFAGTYDEIPTPNVALNPDEIAGYQFILEGDPADDRTNIIIAPTAGTNGIYVNIDSSVIRHLAVSKAAGTTGINGGAANYSAVVKDVVVTMTGGGNGVYGYRSLLLVDSVIVITGGASYGVTVLDGTLRVHGCDIKLDGGGIGINPEYGVDITHTTVRNAATVVGHPTHARTKHGSWSIRNCTFYNCTDGLSTYARFGMLPYTEVFDTIFKDVDYPYAIRAAWPEETATSFGPYFLQRNNCYHNYTAYARNVTGGATKTAAQWAAMSETDVAGELDATDPLLTDPGAGDFSLAADSPCKRTGAGSGVPTDVDGVAYDMQNPDMGAVSSGSGTSAPSTGIITTVPGTVTVPVTLGGAPYVRARLLDAEYVQEDEQTEASEGAGTIALTAASAGWKYVVAWGVSAGDDPIGEPGTVERIWVPPAAVTVYYSIDGGTSWVAAAGDAWPVTAGEHIVRLHVRNAELSRRIMVKIESTDADVWGVRRIIVKGNRKLQEMSLE